MTPLGRALLAVDPDMPRAFRAVDARVSEATAPPDLVERSIAIRPDGVAPWRATYYFDAAESGAGVAELLGAAAADLGVPVPAALSAKLARPSVLQHVLGVDAEPPARLKRYLVMRRPDAPFVSELLARLGREAGPLALERVCIVGFDLDAGGLADVKLYFRLERDEVGAYLRGRPELAPVLAGSREVVFGHRLSGARARTMYFHADGPDVLAADLARRARASEPARAALEHLRALDARHPMTPWICGIPYDEQHGLARDRATLYLHPR